MEHPMNDSALLSNLQTTRDGQCSIKYEMETPVVSTTNVYKSERHLDKGSIYKMPFINKKLFLNVYTQFLTKMDFFSLFVTLLWCLPFLSTAVPVADPVAEPEMHLEKRKSAQTCKIVNLNKGQYVNCRYGATTKAGNIFAFSKGDKLIFSCKKKGQCVKGNW